MPTPLENVVALWLWPLNAIQLGGDMMGAMASAQRVIAARLPTLVAAAHDPLGADHAEMRLMVTEKVGAFGTSARSMKASSDAVHRATNANARALGRVAAGHILWPGDWMALVEKNLAAAAALAAAPAAAFAPLHRGVTVNEKRLRRSPGQSGFAA